MVFDTEFVGRRPTTGVCGATCPTSENPRDARYVRGGSKRRQRCPKSNSLAPPAADLTREQPHPPPLLVMAVPLSPSEKEMRPLVVPPPLRSGFRWRILALLFFATTINYLDRSILTVLAPILQYKVFHWTDAGYAQITMTFQAAYALGLISMGAIIDKLGTRIGYLLSIVTWSCFGMLHAAIRPAFGVAGFVVARFGLGFGEAGNYPAAVKTVAEWF